MSIIERKLFPEITRLSREKAILILHEARQTGKSTTLRWWLDIER